METTYHLTPNDLKDIIKNTVKETLQELEKSNNNFGLMLSKNEARKILHIGYKKLYEWIADGTLKEVNGKIPYSEIEKLQNPEKQNEQL